MNIRTKLDETARGFCCAVCEVLNEHPSCEELKAFVLYQGESSTMDARCHARIARHLRMDQCPPCRQEVDALCLRSGAPKPVWWDENRA